MAPKILVAYACRAGSTAGVAEAIGRTLTDSGLEVDVRPMADGEQYRPQVGDWLREVRTVVRPVSEGLFAGAFDLAKVPSFADRLKFRLAILSGAWPTGDRRDWEAIRAWAAETRPLLVG